MDEALKDIERAVYLKRYLTEVRRGVWLWSDCGVIVVC